MNKHFFPHSKRPKASKRPHDSFLHRVMNDPYLDWFYMVMFTLILSIVYIVIGVFSFLHVRDSLSATSENELTSIENIFSPEKLSKTLKNFENRAKERAGAVSGYSGVGDPSL